MHVSQFGAQFTNGVLQSYLGTLHISQHHTAGCTRSASVATGLYASFRLLQLLLTFLTVLRNAKLPHCQVLRG